jgi:hypothetical protein
MLDTALSGLRLGPVDQDARDRLTGLDPVSLDPAVAAAVVAGWVRRGFETGLAAGRAEVLDEAAAVRQARAEADVYGQVVDDVVTAATEAEPAVEDDTADARAVLRALLARIERAVAGVGR